MTSSNFTKANNFEFISGDFKLLLIGYPTWEASIASAESDIWLKVSLSIDISKRLIFHPTASNSTKKLAKNILTEMDFDKSLQLKYKEKLNGFFDSIPQYIVEVVSAFPDSHWDFVKAIRFVGDDLLILAKTNPVLAYAVVNIEKINPSFSCFENITLLKRMIKTKHKEIIKLLGFPEAERMVKIFSKMELPSITVRDLVDLRNVLMIKPEITEQILKLLSFAKNINKRLLRLVTVCYLLLPKMTHKLMFEVVSSESYKEILKSLSEISYCVQQQLNDQIPKLTSLNIIDRINKQLNEELRRKLKKDQEFSSPPLPDNCFVKAIRTESELINWANKQHNCLSDYIGKVLTGKCYFYRVIYNNEEATLELKLNDYKIRKGDLLGNCNRVVSSALKKVVKSWLKEN